MGKKLTLSQIQMILNEEAKVLKVEKEEKPKISKKATKKAMKSDVSKETKE